MIKQNKKAISFPKSNFLARVKKQAGQKKGKLRFVLLFAGLLLLGYLYFAGDFGFVRILSLYKEKKNLKLEIKKLEAKTIDLKLEKKRLETDLGYVERIAREKYGMTKKGERIYKFVRSPAKDLAK